MKEIGGYFGLEINNGQYTYHETLYKLKSGRSALGLILSSVKPEHVLVPFYTCDALLEPLVDANISYTFYNINADLELDTLPEIGPRELLIYINYYDIKRSYVQQLSLKYKDRLIVDCTQSYYLRGNGISWYFNSSRKFYGVPDGADLYAPAGQQPDKLYQKLSVHKASAEHLVHRLNGDTRIGYPYFQRNELANGGEISRMSVMSGYLLSNTDHARAMQCRQANFKYLHERLGPTNCLNIEKPAIAAPSFYPYLHVNSIEKHLFWDQQVFVPIFWQDVLIREPIGKFEWERNLAQRLLPLPVDHRYGEEHMEIMLDIIKKI